MGIELQGWESAVLGTPMRAIPACPFFAFLLTMALAAHETPSRDGARHQRWLNEKAVTIPAHPCPRSHPRFAILRTHS